MTTPDVPGYQLGSVIARGSSATVWAATCGSGEGDLAVKVVPLPHGEDEERLAFELSALTSTVARGDHLIDVLDVVAVTDLAPSVAIVMPRLRHGTLARLVATRGHLTPGEVVTMLTPVALTVAELHEAALVHGDISAGNIGFDGLGRPVVLDLGVGTVIGADREHVYGTPGFVAPEVVAGAHPTPAADVYALGAVGWYALTGELPPIPAGRPALVDLVPAAPSALADAIERALHPDPPSRGDGRELATAVYASATAVPIQPVAGDDPALMLTHRVRELARAAEPETRVSRRARHTELRSGDHAARLRVLATFVAAVLLGAVGVGVAAWGRESPEPLVSPPVAPVAQPVDYERVVQDLVDARARAWVEADPAALQGAFASDSEAMRRDEALIAEAESAGHSYAGLAFAVGDTRVLSETDTRVRVATTLATSAYAVRTDAEDLTSVEERPAATSPVVLTLVRSDKDWRILSVEVSGT